MTAEQIIFNKLANGKTITDLGKHKINIGGIEIHYRLKNFPKANPDKFPFNINPNSLGAKFELFICGNEDCYYLLPVDKIKEMHFHPAAYQDKRYPKITIITIDSTRNKVTYASPSISLDITPYKNITLPQS